MAHYLRQNTTDNSILQMSGYSIIIQKRKDLYYKLIHDAIPNLTGKLKHHMYDNQYSSKFMHKDSHSHCPHQRFSDKNLYTPMGFLCIYAHMDFK